MLYDAKIKLNNFVRHFRDDWHWPSWKYLEIEKQRVHQNTRRLLPADDTNRARERPTGSDLLQQSMFGSWNIINERITSTIPSFIRTGETFFHTVQLNINAMLKAFILPTIFATITFFERWPQFQEILHRISGIDSVPTNFL